MRKEDAYDFQKKLLCVHEPQIRDYGRSRRENEFELPNKVRIAYKGGEVIRTAVADFIHFLKVSMGITASAASIETEADIEEADITVMLASDDKVDLQCAASYRGFMIQTDEGGIKVFGHDERGAAGGLYYLEDIMTFAKAPMVAYGEVRKRPLFSPQMVHSGYALDEFPDEYLARIAHEGRDAILVYTRNVNETSRVVDKYMDFNDLIKRAARYGIDVYSYSLMASTINPEEPEAWAFYDNTYGRLFRECPGLKGVVLVGEAVEFPSKDPRVFKGRYFQNSVDGIPTGKPSAGWFPCVDYPIWLNLIKRVIRKENPEADIVFWTYNWGSRPEADRVKLIKSMPTDITLLATFEMFEYRKYDDCIGKCADYTLAFEGPGTYFASEAQAAKESGIRLYTMSNTGGTTWDFGVVPYEPMPQQWMRRFAALREANKEWQLCGLMEGHHYGFYPSFISKLGKWSFWSPQEDMEQVLRLIIGSEFGEENIDIVYDALDYFSEAIRHYVPSAEDQYGAFRTGPSYPFCLYKVTPIPSDEKARFGNKICHAMYQPRDWGDTTLGGIRVHAEIRSLEKMRAFMQAGIAKMETVEKPNEKLEELINMGRFIYRTVETGIRAKRWYILKNQLMAETDRKKLYAVLRDMEQLLQDEMENAEATISLVEADSRLGWEPTMFYITDKWHLEWKIRQIKYVLASELEPLMRSVHVKVQ